MRSLSPLARRRLERFRSNRRGWWSLWLFCGLFALTLGGELIAAWLDNEPLPLPRSVAEACHPNRFALRGLIRGKGKQTVGH
ncbi:hypothetical protein B1F69_03750 [Pseudomonas syringae]|nr:hypothetical protein B1F69_03750 [Pseudomonas syringae]